MKNKFITLLICISVNIVLALFVQTLNIPLLFLDTVGTIFGAISLGPLFGAIIGGLSNIILGFISNPFLISYVLANIVLGLLVGFISKKRGFSYKEAYLIGFILSIICPLISTPISLYIFGDINGNGWNLFYSILSKSSEIIFSGVFIPRLVSNMVDKVLSCLIVSFLLSKISKKYLHKISELNEEIHLSNDLLKSS